MKLVIVLVVCCISATWQQQGFYSNYYPSWLPQYYPLPYNYGPSIVQHYRHPFAQRPIDDESKAKESNILFKNLLQQKKAEQQQQTLEGSIEGRLGSSNKPEERLFGLVKWFGLDNLFDYLGTSLLVTTSTAYATTTSTLTVSSLVTCYTSTMFTSTTACRRKRMMLPGLLVGDDGIDEPKITPSKVNILEPSVIESLIRNHRAAHESNAEIASSLDTDTEAVERPDSPAINRFVREKIAKADFDETVYITTSTVIAYSLSTTSITKTVTNIASSTALTCLPACFTLC